MTGKPIGRSPGLFEVRRLLVYSDRVEQASAGLFGLELRRLTFDELTYATVQRRLPPWTDITLGVLSALLGLALGGLGVWQRSLWLLVPAALAWVGVLIVVLAAWLRPAHMLVVYTAEQSVRTLLPRGAAAREDALGYLVRAVENHQGLRGQSASAGAAPAPVGQEPA